MVPAMKSQLRFPGVALLLLGGGLLDYLAVAEVAGGTSVASAYGGGLITIAYAVVLTVTLLLLARALWADRMGAWGCAVPMAVWIIVTAVLLRWTSGLSPMGLGVLAAVAAVGLLVTAFARFRAARSKGVPSS
jgi:hypothetical protein